jgi:hypothetical protein
LGPGKHHGFSRKGKKPMDEETVERILDRMGERSAINLAHKDQRLKAWDIGGFARESRELSGKAARNDAELLAHITPGIPEYHGDMTQRDLAVDLAGYLARRPETHRPEEAGAARVLRELVKNQRLG